MIFDNNMNTIGDHFLYQVRGQMHFYSIHVIAKYNLSGSQIICRQIIVQRGLVLYRQVIDTDFDKHRMF